MLYTLSLTEFRRALTEKQRKNEYWFAQYSGIVGNISRFWLEELGPQKAVIMFFVLGRSLYFHKEAAQIWSYQFLDGVRQQDGQLVCTGVGMSENTLRKHLKELIEADFLDVYAAKSTRGTESEARLFAINCKKIMSRPLESTEKNMLAIPKKLKESSESGDSQNLRGGLPNFGGHNICNSNRRSKLLLSPPSGEPGTGVVVPIPKKRTNAAPTQREERSAEEVISKVAHIHEARRVVRTAAAETKSPWLLSQREVQALFDRKMAMYHPDEPRLMVTGKEYGFLKKRLKDSAPKDFTDFVDWTLRHWHSTAMSSRRSAAKKLEAGGARPVAPMSLTPDFAQLAYRYPYFLKVYQSSIAERRESDREDAQQETVRRLQARVANAEQTNKQLRRRLQDRAKPSTPEPVSATRVTRTSVVRPTGQVGGDYDDLPTWEEMNEKGQRHAKQR